jgi:FMN reductase
MGGSSHHYLGVDSQLRFILAWFGALVAPTSVYLTSRDFADGKLASEDALQELLALCETLKDLAEGARGKTLGPAPLAVRFS